MSLVLSFHEPRYVLSRGLSQSQQSQQSKQLHHQNNHNQTQSLSQWELQYRHYLENICEFMFQSVIQHSENNHSMIINKTMLYQKLVKLAYSSSSNTSKRYVMCK